MIKLSYTREAKLTFAMYKVDREVTVMELAKKFLLTKFAGCTVSDGMNKWGLKVDFDQTDQRNPSTINMLVVPNLPYPSIGPSTTFRQHMVDELMENNATCNFEPKDKKITRRSSLGHVDTDLDIKISLEWVEQRKFEVPYTTKVGDVRGLVEIDCFDGGLGKVTAMQFLHNRSQHNSMFLRSVPKTNNGTTWVLVKTFENVDEKELAKLVTPKVPITQQGILRKRSLEFAKTGDINKKLKF